MSLQKCFFILLMFTQCGEGREVEEEIVFPAQFHFESIELSFYNGINEVICIHVNHGGNFTGYKKKNRNSGMFYKGHVNPNTMDFLFHQVENIMATMSADKIYCLHCGVYHLVIKDRLREYSIYGTLLGSNKITRAMVETLLEVFDGEKTPTDTSFLFESFQKIKQNDGQL